MNPSRNGLPPVTRAGRCHDRRPRLQQLATISSTKEPRRTSPSSSGARAIGSRRMSFVLDRALLPDDEERILDGNVSFTSDYLSRALATLEPGDRPRPDPFPPRSGLARDERGRRRRRARSPGRRRLRPVRTAASRHDLGHRRHLERQGLGRVCAVHLRTCRDPRCPGCRLGSALVELPPGAEASSQPSFPPKWLRSAFGVRRRKQTSPEPESALSGSVASGSIVAEGLSRMGVSDIVLIDHDHIELRNLDRTLHADLAESRRQTFKVDVAARGIADSHTAAERHRCSRCRSRY